MRPTIDELTAEIRAFRDARDWRQFHNPKELAVAITAEAGELLQHFVWQNPEQSERRMTERRAEIEDEIADVAILLFELADNSGIDLAAAMRAKLARNEARYPVDKARGSNASTTSCERRARRAPPPPPALRRQAPAPVRGEVQGTRSGAVPGDGEQGARRRARRPPASHVPIMVAEVLEVLGPRPGDIVVDCTIGYGGHARALLDADPAGREAAGPRRRSAGTAEDRGAAARLRASARTCVIVRRSNFAGLPAVLPRRAWPARTVMLADLGVSSMQLDTPARGFSFKTPGPLDMRMNPQQGPAGVGLAAKDQAGGTGRDPATRTPTNRMPAMLAEALAGQAIEQTTDLADADSRDADARAATDEREQSVRRVFQALRIAVNEEFTALDTLLRHLPACLNPGGRAAILTFHSGEDRRVKKAFQAGLRDGLYGAIAEDPSGPPPRSAAPTRAPAPRNCAGRGGRRARHRHSDERSPACGPRAGRTSRLSALDHLASSK